MQPAKKTPAKRERTPEFAAQRRPIDSRHYAKTQLQRVIYRQLRWLAEGW